MEASRRARNRLVGSLAVVALLCGVGVVGGYGLGRAVDAVQAMLPGADPGLPAAKIAPPEPIDLTGPATTCRADAVDLGLSLGSPTVTVGDPLVFSVRVTNTGRVPCLFDGADASRTVTVTDPSGKDRVWSSGDCAADGETMLLLGPEHVAPRDVRWRTGRSVAGCKKDQPALEPGAYQAQAALGDVPGAMSTPVTFTVVAPTPPPDPTPDPSATAGDGKAADGKAADGKAADDETTEKADTKATDEPSDAEPATDD